MIIASANSVHSYRWVRQVSALQKVVWLSSCHNKFASIDNVDFIHCRNLFVMFLMITFYRLRYHKVLIHVHYLGWNIVPLLFQINPVIVATPWGSDIHINEKNFWKNLTLKWFIQKVSMFTSDSNYILQNINNRFGGELTDVLVRINFAVDTEEYQPIKRKQSLKLNNTDNINVIHARGFNSYHDISTVLHGFKIFVDTIKGFQPSLHLFADGAEVDLARQLVADLEMVELVFFHGPKDHETLRKAIEVADILISASRSDGGLASSTAEAMACEVCVLVSDVLDNDDWIENGVNGYLFEPGNYKQLGELMKRIVENPLKLDAIGKAARKTVMKKNSVETETEKIKKVYEHVLSG